MRKNIFAIIFIIIAFIFLFSTSAFAVGYGDNANNPHTTDGVKIWDDIYPVQTTVDGRNLYLFLTRTPLDVDGPLMTLKLEDVF